MNRPPNGDGEDQLGFDEVALLTALVAALPLASPPPHGRARLLEAARHGRFAAFAPRVAALFALDLAAAEQLLDTIDEPEAWRPTRLPGIARIPVRTGPQCRGAQSELVRVDPGARIPAHRHLGEERLLVLQGCGRCDDGALLRRGGEYVSPPGSQHALTIEEDLACIFAVVVEKGLRLLGPDERG